MRVLFAAPYRDGTGYGQAAIDYILALDAADVDVVPGMLRYNDRFVDIPPRLAELEGKSLSNIDVVIQNTVPNMFDYNGHIDKNIGLFFTETSNFHSQIDWVRHCNFMDELWVGSKDSVQHVIDSNVYTPVTRIGVPCDPGKYAKRYEPFPIQEIQDKFTFYFIADYQRRKNLVALLKAFHLEFHKREDVAICLKVSVSGKSQQESIKQTVDCCNVVKEQLALYDRLSDYNEENIICDFLDEDEIMSLHATCDCFVMPSFAEGWCRPAFDAMAMGNTPICSDIGGIRDFLTPECGDLIPVQPQPVFGMKEWTQVPRLYTGNQTWWDIEIPALRKAMRETFENPSKEKKNAGIDRAYDFTHEIIGQRMKGLLDRQMEIGVSDRASSLRQKHIRQGLGHSYV